MRAYIELVLKSRDDLVFRTYATPADNKLFQVAADAEVLTNIAIFHTTVAKLLYLAKRARPDILRISVKSFLY